MGCPSPDHPLECQEGARGGAGLGSPSRPLGGLLPSWIRREEAVPWGCWLRSDVFRLLAKRSFSRKSGELWGRSPERPLKMHALASAAHVCRRNLVPFCRLPASRG